MPVAEIYWPALNLVPRSTLCPNWEAWKWPLAAGRLPLVCMRARHNKESIGASTSNARSCQFSCRILDHVHVTKLERKGAAADCGGGGAAASANASQLLRQKLTDCLPSCSLEIRHCIILLPNARTQLSWAGLSSGRGREGAAAWSWTGLSTLANTQRLGHTLVTQTN